VAVLSGTPYHRLLVALACGLALGAFYFVIVFVSPRGMGLGDAKLAMLVGLVSGWFGVRAAVLAVVAGVLYAGAAAIVLVLTRRASRADRLAYGPFMLLGALTAIVLTR
jgi:leader peptidase (prepilin peptidase)/N-methyltransferase